MINWDLNFQWEKQNNHGDESYNTVVELPEAFGESYATINVGFGPEMGGHSVMIYDKDDVNGPPLVELHRQYNGVAPCEAQARALAHLMVWAMNTLAEMNEGADL